MNGSFSGGAEADTRSGLLLKAAVGWSSARDQIHIRRCGGTTLPAWAAAPRSSLPYSRKRQLFKAVIISHIQSKPGAEAEVINALKRRKHVSPG